MTDITYIPTDEGWLYLASIMDLYSRKIVGWAMQPSMHRNLVLKALAMAVSDRQPAPGLIHHSDRGSQYASEEYRRALSDCGLVASMSRSGCCYDNACGRELLAHPQERVDPPDPLPNSRSCQSGHLRVH